MCATCVRSCLGLLTPPDPFGVVTGVGTSASASSLATSIASATDVGSFRLFNVDATSHRSTGATVFAPSSHLVRLIQ